MMIKSLIPAAALVFSASLLSASQAACPPGLTQEDIVPPTDKSRTFIRLGAGEFGSARGSKTHTGVDILTRASYPDREAYAVYALGAGTVAYAKFNGVTLDDGFGNTIVVDHGNDCYSMYAHLASDPFTPMNDESSALLMSKGQTVAKGELIGYFVDQTVGVHSTGNAMRTAAGARWQTHFELWHAPSGRSGATLKAIYGEEANRTDPTSTLLSLGYKIEDIAQ
ncbi:M23 family metallopeptidase [Mesorhizobium sp. 1B3]|uniref:M23 family metallopeptidase n=1 Tax=Mesorhizobium sp. 1B3 TaxID=3243599 RepID=UPI003D9924AE